MENSLKRNHLEEFKTTQLHQVNPLPAPRPEWVDLINGGNQRVEEREQWNYNNRFGNASGGAEELLPTPRGVQASMMNLQKYKTKTETETKQWQRWYGVDSISCHFNYWLNISLVYFFNFFVEQLFGQL